MKTPRNVKHSFYAALEALFESAATFGAAFNVYYESDLRDSNHTPVKPYIYLLDAGVKFPEKLPFVSIWFAFSYREIQLGGPAWWHAQISCDVYGENRGDREDIAAAIVEGISSSFAISDYSADAPSAWGTASIYESAAGDLWTMLFESAGDEYAVQGTLLNWASVSTQCWCKPT